MKEATHLAMYMSVYAAQLYNIVEMRMFGHDLLDSLHVCIRFAEHCMMLSVDMHYRLHGVIPFRGVCVCVYVYVSASVSVSVSVSVCVCVSVSVSVSMCMSVYVSMCMCLCVCVVASAEKC
jgi:hypothetical protein